MGYVSKKIEALDSLHCTQCGVELPKSHHAYRYYHKEVLAKKRPAFCCNAHASTYKNAHYTPEQVARRVKKQLATGLAAGSYLAGASKAHKTNVQLYGSDYAERRLEKGRATYKRTYGFDSPGSRGSPARARHEAVIADKYGVDNVSQIPTVKSKVSAVMTAKYGGRGLASPAIAEKIKQTNLRRYGVEHTNQHPDIHARAMATFKLAGKAKAAATRRRNGTDLKEAARKAHETKKRNGTYTKSSQELCVLRRLRALLGPQVEHLYRHPDYPGEADFYDPVTGTIFEYQGYFTHGSAPYDAKDQDHRREVRRLKKMVRSGDKWASALTLKIWTKVDPARRSASVTHEIPYVEWFSTKEFESWFDSELAKLLGASAHRHGCFKVGDLYVVRHDSPYLRKAQASSTPVIVIYPWDDLRKVAKLVNTSSALYARKLEVVVLSKSTADKFCAKYHLQGACRGVTFAVGLVIPKSPKPTLVAVMTFGKPRYNKNYDLELLRLCFSANVVGGTQKMWKHARSHLSGSLISYCDLAKFKGTIYSALGFSRSRRPRPSRHWYNEVTGQRVSDNLLRQRGFSQLVRTKEVYAKGDSNELLMKAHGFVPILDCGQVTFVKDAI